MFSCLNLFPTLPLPTLYVPSALDKHRISFRSLPIAIRATALPHQPAMLLPTTTDLGTLYALNLIHRIPRIRQIIVWVTYIWPPSNFHTITISRRFRRGTAFRFAALFQSSSRAVIIIIIQFFNGGLTSSQSSSKSLTSRFNLATIKFFYTITSLTPLIRMWRYEKN